MNANARTERTLPAQATHQDPGLALFAELIGLLQMHRGASLAALGGLENFHQQATALHPQIDTLLAKVAYQAIQTDPAQWQLITGEWENTRRHWRQDSALANFEIHNFLIEQCHRLLWQYVESRPQLGQSEADEFLFRDVPLHVEGLGQLRGLASYCLTQTPDAAEYQQCLPRVAQLSKQSHSSLVETQRVLIRMANQLQKASSQYPSLLPTLQARVKLTGQFLQMVQTQLDAKTDAKPQPEKLFQIGTLAIEANQKVWTLLAQKRLLAA
ncbi:hypothetical protein [Simiduia agarivorans]|uniref:Uncharacterized protein n=1 Tax=Simiduia agarivorans (strain DSM 21679 / JCM 13881 / BCRC 17597 / SA1) TaxID=1117647 RepID=K4KH60_SIMAS|nr:hypothetical protein [Simiduia agarivorans]AFU98444.2 hypothetical protein M5M_06245 [Simiduia agarivorans SA1 = DSM 21679]